jgi:hypothetical protein
LLVVEAADEQESFTERSEWLEHLTEFHPGALAFCPPLFGVESIAGEGDGETDWRFGVATLGGGCGAELERFHPRKCHGNADATEKGSAGERILVHGVEEGCGVMSEE